MERRIQPAFPCAHQKALGRKASAHRPSRCSGDLRAPETRSPFSSYACPPREIARHRPGTNQPESQNQRRHRRNRTRRSHCRSHHRHPGRINRATCSAFESRASIAAYIVVARIQTLLNLSFRAECRVYLPSASGGRDTQGGTCFAFALHASIAAYVVVAAIQSLASSVIPSEVSRGSFIRPHAGRMSGHVERNLLLV